MPQEGACARWESRPAAQICSLLAVEPWAGHLPPNPGPAVPSSVTWSLGVGRVGSSEGVLTSKALPSSDVPEPGSYEGSGGIHRKFCEIPVCFASEASGLSSPLWRGPDPPSPMHRCRISPSSIYPSPKGFLSVAAALRRGPARPGSLRAGGQDRPSL